MKLLYQILLVLAVLTALFLVTATFAIPRDAHVASVLSNFPSEWELSLNDKIKNRLANYDIKNESITALRKGASLQEKEISRLFIYCIGIIVFSGIGLVRESKFLRLKRKIEQSAP